MLTRLQEETSYHARFQEKCEGKTRTCIYLSEDYIGGKMWTFKGHFASETQLECEWCKGSARWSLNADITPTESFLDITKMKWNVMTWGDKNPPLSSLNNCHRIKHLHRRQSGMAAFRKQPPSSGPSAPLCPANFETTSGHAGGKFQIVSGFETTYQEELE
jgi:hypothetical protein